MKKIVTLSLLGLANIAVLASPPTLFTRVAKSHKASQVAPAKVWCAKTQNVQVYQGLRWVTNETYTSKYDSKGQVIENIITSPSETAADKETFTYSEHGFVTSKTAHHAYNGVDFMRTALTTKKYDPVVHHLVVENLDYQCAGDDEAVQVGNNFRRNITRNAAGNITQCEIAVLYQGDFDPIERTIVEYGSDGKPSKIEEWNLEYDLGGKPIWTLTATYTELKWEACSGQIYSSEVLFSQGNKLTAATMTDEDGSYKLTATYSGNLGSYKARLEYEEDGEYVVLQMNMDVLDEIGSYDMTVTTDYISSPTEIYRETSIEKLHYAPCGLEELIYYSYKDGNEPEEIAQWTVGEITYDTEYGYPLTHTYKSYYDGKWQNELRVAYTDYFDAASVNTVAAETDTTEHWYTLQGLPIASPTSPGIYIHRQGTKIAKKIVK